MRSTNQIYLGRGGSDAKPGRATSHDSTLATYVTGFGPSKIDKTS